MGLGLAAQVDYAGELAACLAFLALACARARSHRRAAGARARATISRRRCRRLSMCSNASSSTGNRADLHCRCGAGSRARPWRPRCAARPDRSSSPDVREATLRRLAALACCPVRSTCSAIPSHAGPSRRPRLVHAETGEEVPVRADKTGLPDRDSRALRAEIQQRCGVPRDPVCAGVHVPRCRRARCWADDLRRRGVTEAARGGLPMTPSHRGPSARGVLRHRSCIVYLHRLYRLKRPTSRHDPRARYPAMRGRRRTARRAAPSASLALMLIALTTAFPTSRRRCRRWWSSSAARARCSPAPCAPPSAACPPPAPAPSAPTTGSIDRPGRRGARAGRRRRRGARGARAAATAGLRRLLVARTQAWATATAAPGAAYLAVGPEGQGEHDPAGLETFPVAGAHAGERRAAALAEAVRRPACPPCSSPRLRRHSARTTPGRCATTSPTASTSSSVPPTTATTTCSPPASPTARCSASTRRCGAVRRSCSSPGRRRRPQACRSAGCGPSAGSPHRADAAALLADPATPADVRAALSGG